MSSASQADNSDEQKALSTCSTQNSQQVASSWCPSCIITSAVGKALLTDGLPRLTQCYMSTESRYPRGIATWGMTHTVRTWGRNILMFPKGKDAGHLALYLNAADNATQSFGWQRKASFKLMVLNQLDPAKSVSRGIGSTSPRWGPPALYSKSDNEDTCQPRQHESFGRSFACACACDIICIEMPFLAIAGPLSLLLLICTHRVIWLAVTQQHIQHSVRVHLYILEAVSCIREWDLRPKRHA